MYDSKYLLKTINPHFQAVWYKTKKAEIRYTGDRKFEVGRRYRLREFDVAKGYLDRYVDIEITHILPFEEFPEGLKPGYAMLSFVEVERGEVATHDT